MEWWSGAKSAAGVDTSLARVEARTTTTKKLSVGVDVDGWKIDN